jgi:hypothetical protein
LAKAKIVVQTLVFQRFQAIFQKAEKSGITKKKKIYLKKRLLKKPKNGAC